MNVENKKRGSNMIPEQKRDLIEFMKANPQIQKGVFSNDFTFKKAQNMWMNISNKLNAQPGAKKEWKMWRKTWQDLKAITKKKQSLIKTDRTKTGGGPPLQLGLTLEEEQISQFIAPSPSHGHKTPETYTEFIFDEVVEETPVYEQIPVEKTTVYELVPTVTNTESELEFNPNIQDHSYSCDKEISIKNADKINNSKKGRIRKPVRVKRLTHTLSATEKLAKQTEEKICHNKEYLNKKLELMNKKLELMNKKLELMKQDIAAKNRIAIALETISESLKVIDK